MAGAIADYLDNVELLRTHGAAGRRRCEQFFSLGRMVRDYEAVYDTCLGAGVGDGSAAA